MESYSLFFFFLFLGDCKKLKKNRRGGKAVTDVPTIFNVQCNSEGKNWIDENVILGERWDSHGSEEKNGDSYRRGREEEEGEN